MVCANQNSIKNLIQIGRRTWSNFGKPIRNRIDDIGNIACDENDRISPPDTDPRQSEPILVGLRSVRDRWIISN